MCACACQFIETCAIQRGNLAVWNQRSRRELPAHYWRVFTRRAISACIWMVALVYAWWLMFSDLPSPNDRNRRSSGVDLIHALSIALPLVLLLVFAIALLFERRRARKARRIELNNAADREHRPRDRRGVSGDRLTLFVEDRVMLGAIMRLWLGLFLCSISATLWMVTEGHCDEVNFFKVFPGHLIWHIGMTLGLLNCLVYAALLRADNFSQHPRFVGAGNCCIGLLYFSILPGLVFLVDDEDQRYGGGGGARTVNPRSDRERPQQPSPQLPQLPPPAAAAAATGDATDRKWQVVPAGEPTTNGGPGSFRDLFRSFSSRHVHNPWARGPSALELFEGGEAKDEADMHLGVDPLLLGVLSLSRMLGCAKCCCCDEGGMCCGACCDDPEEGGSTTWHPDLGGVSPPASASTLPRSLDPQTSAMISSERGAAILPVRVTITPENGSSSNGSGGGRSAGDLVVSVPATDWLDSSAAQVEMGLLGQPKSSSSRQQSCRSVNFGSSPSAKQILSGSGSGGQLSSPITRQESSGFL